MFFKKGENGWMKFKAKRNYCSLSLQPQELCMKVLVAQLFRIILLVICDLSANSITQSCTGAPNEVRFKAENLVSNRSKKKVLVRALCM